MTSTYSPSLRLELMATGDQSGTWGTTTNTNLGTLLEQAITGVLSVAEGDTTLTLTTVNGGSDQARNAVVNLTGAMTGAHNVVVPTANKLYLIKNSTTGGYAVTVKTASGSGVAIAAGTSQWVYCDGTNVVQGLVGGSIDGGTITNITGLTMASGVASPATNDAAALGTGALSWSDLFLASGAVINIANGNWVATHTSAILTVGTGDLRITTAGTNTASVVTVGGTQTLTNKTLTSPAVTGNVALPSGGVLNWNSGNVTLTQSAGALALSGSAAALLDISASVAGQIKFPAAQNASSNANTLDDYEEGTFTPAWVCTSAVFSYASQYGGYTKIGDRAFINLRLALNTSGNTLQANTLTISGLPFANGETQAVTSVIAWTAATSSLIMMIVSQASAATVLDIYQSAAAVTSLIGTAGTGSTSLHATNGSVHRVNSYHYKV